MSIDLQDSSAVGDDDDDEEHGLDQKAITASLLSAIHSLDVEKVEMLLKCDFEIDYHDIHYHSVLHIVVRKIAIGARPHSSWEDELTRNIDPVDKHLNPLHRSATFLRIVQSLLESGGFNVNSLDSSSNTTLHYAVEHCRCRIFPCDEYKYMVNATIELLLKNNANINAKTSNGETTLMIASVLGCKHIVQVLLDWRDEGGAPVDLNARDVYGETALIKAAKWARVDVVELLLQHGCVDSIQDHRGFYALHAVICGLDLIGDAWRDFLGSIGIVDASEETLALLPRNGTTAFIGYIKNLNRKDDIQKIVRMLVTFGRANVNSKDFRGNTVLNMAVKPKLRISQETIDTIMECGRSFCASANGHPENSEITFQNADYLGKTPLHRLSAVLLGMPVWQKRAVFHSSHFLARKPHKDVFEAMAVAKDYRGRTALHYAGVPSFVSSSRYGDRVLLKNILKLKHIINERDNYGRTPLHYCQDMNVYKSLVEQGADEHIQDIDGKAPQDFKQLLCEEDDRSDLPLPLTDARLLYRLDEAEICEELVGGNSELAEYENMRILDADFAERIWKDANYAYRDHFSRALCDKVRQFMNRLSEKIGRKDPRFECQPVLIGSAEEGTKIGLPDEFDFNFILTKLSELCEVVPSPEASSGFVHLKRRYNNGERWHANQDFNNEENLVSFFNNDSFLLTTEIASRFRILYQQILSESEFWDGEDVFERETYNEIGFVYFKEEEELNTSENDFRPSTHPCSSIRLKLNRPINGRYMFRYISIDIVPCIRIKDFWPGEALSSLSDEIKSEGCHLMFDQPQRKYPWVPFSDPFARISFAPAESRMIKECSAVARAAYLVGKQVIFNRPEFTYVLKTCLLYCIEALKDCTSNSLLYEDINPTELRYFVEKLMFCFHEFYLQDFLPCYMMPSFHLPIKGYLKSNHDKFLNYKDVYSRLACRFYWVVCKTEHGIDVCIPTHSPLNEHFDREELLRKLSVDISPTSSVEHRRVQPATKRKIRSDSNSELQLKSKTSRKKKKTDECEQDQSENERSDSNEPNDVGLSLLHSL